MATTATIAPRQLPLQTPPIARKRKRPVQYSVSYSEVQEVDAAGRTRDVIVIEDTPPPSAQQGLPHASAFNHPASQSAGTVTVSPAYSTSTTRTSTNGFASMSMQPPIFGAPVRTRARAAAEAQQLQMGSASTSSAASLATTAAAVAQPVAKKRKREPGAGDVDALTTKKLLTGAGAKYTNAVGQSQWQNGAAVQQSSTEVRSYFFIHRRTVLLI